MPEHGDFGSWAVHDHFQLVTKGRDKGTGLLSWGGVDKRFAAIVSRVVAGIAIHKPAFQLSRAEKAVVRGMAMCGEMTGGCGSCSLSVVSLSSDFFCRLRPLEAELLPKRRNLGQNLLHRSQSSDALIAAGEVALGGTDELATIRSELGEVALGGRM